MQITLFATTPTHPDQVLACLSLLLCPMRLNLENYIYRFLIRLAQWEVQEANQNGEEVRTYISQVLPWFGLQPSVNTAPAEQRIFHVSSSHWKSLTPFLLFANSGALFHHYSLLLLISRYHVDFFDPVLWSLNRSFIKFSSNFQENVSSISFYFS